MAAMKRKAEINEVAESLPGGVDWASHQCTDAIFNMYQTAQHTNLAKVVSDGFFALVEKTETTHRTLEITWMETVFDKLSRATSAVAIADRDWLIENCTPKMILVKLQTKNTVTATSTVEYFDGTVRWENGPAGIFARI